MKNPLIKRLPREFTGEIAKYIVIFIFMPINGNGFKAPQTVFSENVFCRKQVFYASQ